MCIHILKPCVYVSWNSNTNSISSNIDIGIIGVVNYYSYAHYYNNVTIW